MKRTAIKTATTGFLGLVALTAPTGTAAQERSVLELLDVQGRMVRPGTALVGELSANDYVFQNGERVQAWGLAVTEPSTWRVELNSSDFDPYLRVLGPGLGLGRMDDDGGDGLNASLCVQLEPGNYRLVASGLYGNTGRYSLHALPTIDQTSCASGETAVGVEMDPEDMTPQGTLRAGESGTAVLTEDVTFLEEPAQTWILQGSAGERLRIDVRSDDFDTYLYVDGPGLEIGENNDDDNGCGLGSLVEVTLPETGSYLITATSFFGTVGEYTVTVAGADDGELGCDDGSDDFGGDDMFTADRIDLSGTVAVGSIRVGGSQLGSLDAGSDRVGGANADVWTFEAAAGQSVAITLAADFDPKVFLVSGLLDEDYSDDDGGDGLDSRLCTVTPASGQYEVVVRGYSTDSRGSYTLAIQADPPVASCNSFWRTSAQQSEASADFSASVRDDLQGVLSVGETVRGTLGPLHPADPVTGRPIEAWSLPLAAGQDVTLDERAGFDTWLSVLGPDGEEWFNDDGPCGLNSSLTFTATAAGDYLVLASSLGTRDRDQNYQLSVSAEPTSCTDGLTSQEPAGSIDLNQVRQGALSDASFQTGRGSPADIWTLQLANGGRLVIDMVAGFDTYLQVLDPRGEELTNDDGPCELDSRLVIPNAAAGEYLIVASALGSSMDGSEPYALSVVETERNCSDLPEPDASVDRGTTPSLSSGGSMDFDDIPTEGRIAPLGTEVRGSLRDSDPLLFNDRLGQGWMIELQAGQEVVIELDSDPFDPVLYVASPDGSQTWSDDDGGEGTNSLVRLTAETSGAYKIVVSAYTGTGVFSLRSWRVVR